MTALELKAFLMERDGLNLCGCAELDMALPVIRFVLEWADSNNRPQFDEAWPDSGLYYLVISQLDRAELVEHGTSCRYPFLTTRGEEVLAALQQFSAEDIEAAKGEVNGIWWGDC